MTSAGISPLRVGIAGGSLGGLTAAVLLHELGHDVHVFERSTRALEGRGAGIAVLPMTERYFTDRGGSLGEAEAGAPDVALTLTNWTYVDATGAILDEAATNFRFTSWNTLYRALLPRLPADRYHLSHHVTGVDQDDASATLHFADQPSRQFDLVVGADGIASTVRALVAPETETTYAGYVAWRGTLLERGLSDATQALLADAIIYQVLDRSHILVYAIPGPDDAIVPGSRLLNWVWYRNVAPSRFEAMMTDRNGVHRPATMPPGLAQDQFVDEVRADAASLLAPRLREVIDASDEPFIQAIYDMDAARFRAGRVVLLGDAASALRPHVAAGTAKACADGWALRDHLRDGIDLDAALSLWETDQMALATEIASKSRAMGQASQVGATMVPGDPAWRFGLFSPGN